MPDIASLGIEIDSRPATAAVAALDRLTASASGVVSAIDRFAGSIILAERLQAGLAAASRAMADYDEAAQRATRHQHELKAALNVRDFGGQRRAADVAAYGASLDALRAKYSPLFVAQQKDLEQLAGIGRAEDVGALLPCGAK